MAYIDIEAFLAELSEGTYTTASLYALHESLRPEFEDRIWNSGPGPAPLACGQLVAHAVLTCKAVSALSAAKEHAMAYMNLRTVEENASNLFYILYAGPIVEGRGRDAMAEQFLAYRDIDHRRLVNKQRTDFEAKFQAGWTPKWPGPATLADFQRHCDAVKAKGDATEAKYPKMARGSWHTTDKESRTEAVLKNLPVFVEPEVRAFWESLDSSSSLFNTLVHAGPMLFQQDASKLREGEILEIRGSGHEDLNWSVAAALISYACWCALGDLFGEVDKVKSEWKAQQIAHSTAIMERYRQPAMKRIE